jgi:hypothetical protein
LSKECDIDRDNEKRRATEEFKKKAIAGLSNTLKNYWRITKKKLAQTQQYFIMR